MHDKKIADDYPLRLPLGSVLRENSGFVGHSPPGVQVEMAYKKPKNSELTFSQRLYNHLLNPLRVVIEHTKSGIKRLRMIKDTLRIHSDWFRDTVMLVACGLHNLRVASQQRAYCAPERDNQQNLVA